MENENVNVNVNVYDIKNVKNVKNVTYKVDNEYLFEKYMKDICDYKFLNEKKLDNIHLFTSLQKTTIIATYNKIISQLMVIIHK
jgi:hypothetical protein